MRVKCSDRTPDAPYQVCEATELSNGCWAVKFMEKTFRKRSIHLRNGPPGGQLPAHVRDALRSYAPPVLMKAVELEEQLSQSVRSWTVSVVQASVLFIHFGLEGVMDLMALDCAKIHTAVVAVQRCVHQMQGCIHRFTVDDKGCVMKVCCPSRAFSSPHLRSCAPRIYSHWFGIRVALLAPQVVFGAHMPHEDQPYRALLAALQLRQALSLQGIQPALGVATGESLIGPVGGNVRQAMTI